METDHKKERMILSRSIRRRRRYIEVAFGNNDAARLLLSKEKGVLFESDKAYLPAEDFVLAEFFDRYVNLAFIDYSKVTDTTNKPEKEKTIRPELPAGFLEKLKQMRYSDHTIRVYTTYIGDFQQYFAGSNLKKDFAGRNKCLPASTDRQEKYLFLPTEPTYQRNQVLL